MLSPKSPLVRSPVVLVLLLAATLLALVRSAAADVDMEKIFSRQDRGGDYRPLQFGKRESTFRPLQFGKKSDYRPLQFGKRGSSEGGNDLGVSSLSGPLPPNIHHRQLHLQMQSAGTRRLLNIFPNQHYFSFIDGQGYH